MIQALQREAILQPLYLVHHLSKTLHDLQHASDGYYVSGFNNGEDLHSATQKGTLGEFFLTGARTHGQDSVITANSTVLPEAL